MSYSPRVRLSVVPEEVGVLDVPVEHPVALVARLAADGVSLGTAFSS